MRYLRSTGGEDRFALSSDVFQRAVGVSGIKGIYVLESLATGTPVVQPAHGSFPEIDLQDRWGDFTPPGDAAALADGLAAMLNDRRGASTTAGVGARRCTRNFTDDRMAQDMLKIYRKPAHERHRRSSTRSRLIVSGLSQGYPTPGRAAGGAARRVAGVVAGEALAIVGPSGSGRARC